MKITQKDINKQESILIVIGLFLIQALTILLYLPVPGFGWITGLDQDLLIDNGLVYNFNSTNVLDMFFSTTSGRYQPLTFLSYSIDIGLFGGSAVETIHLVNLIIHLINILLFWRLLHLFSKKLMPALIASLIFAIHPMNLDAVAWISARGILLCAFFFLAALIAHMYYLRLNKKSYKTISTILFLAALLSHPIAVLFPIALIILDCQEGSAIKKCFSDKVLYFVLSLAFILIAVFSSEQGISIGAAVIILPYSFGIFLIKFFIPFGISGIYPVPYQEGLWQAYSINYIPLLGLSAFAGWGAHKLYMLLLNRKVFKIALILLSLIWLVCLTWISFMHLPNWENSDTYWTRVIELYPEDHKAYFYRGDHWAMNSDFERAKYDYSRCIRLNDQAYMAMNNLGLIYLQEKDLRLALDEFSNSIRVNDRFYKAHLNKGLTHMRMGRNDLAIESMNRAIELNPDEPLAYYNRALLYERDNLLDEAIEDLSRAIMLNPYRYMFYKDRGKALVWKQRFEEAELDFSRALEINPSDPEMWFRRSLARVSLNKFEEGLKDALRAQSMGFPVTEDYIKGLTVQILEADSVQLK